MTRRSMESTLRLLWIVLFCTRGEPREPGPVPIVEVHRFELTSPDAEQSLLRARAANDASFGELELQGGLVVIRLEPDVRFVSARVEVRDGLFCLHRRQTPRLAGRIVGRMAFGLLAAELPSELKPGLELVSELLEIGDPAPAPVFRTDRKVILKASTVEQHEGYVAATLLVATGPMTRLEVTRIVTRRAERARRRLGARPVAVPSSHEEALPPERVKSILLGQESDRE